MSGADEGPPPAAQDSHQAAPTGSGPEVPMDTDSLPPTTSAADDSSSRASDAPPQTDAPSSSVPMATEPPVQPPPPSSVPVDQPSQAEPPPTDLLQLAAAASGLSPSLLGPPPPEPSGPGTPPAPASNGSSASTVSIPAASPTAMLNGGPGALGPAAVQSDHCYGLPYQDHNYGGPPVPPAHAPTATGQRPPYPFKVRYPAGLRALQGSPGTGTLGGGSRASGSSSEEGDAREAFPVIGGLDRYLNDEAPEPELLPPPAQPNPRTDGFSPVYQRNAGARSSPVAGGSPQFVGGAGSPRFVPAPEVGSPVAGGSPSAPGYSQHLVQIGGRTYVRQAAAGLPGGPSPIGPVADSSSPGSPVFRNRADFMGIANPPVLIPPYGGRGRGAPKRIGRPRIARNVGNSTGMPMTGPTGPVSTLSSLDPGPAPFVAPAKGNRPSGRGRGPRRRSNLSGSSGLAGPGALSGKNSGVLSQAAMEEEDRGLAFLVRDYERRYLQLHNKGAVEAPAASLGLVRSPPIPVPQASARTLPFAGASPAAATSSLLSATALQKTARPQNGSARTRGTATKNSKASPAKAQQASVPVILPLAKSPTPPPVSPGSLTAPLAFPSSPSLLHQLTCEGSSVAAVVSELHTDALARSAAIADIVARQASPLKPPASPARPKPSPVASPIGSPLKPGLPRSPPAHTVSPAKLEVPAATPGPSSAPVTNGGPAAKSPGRSPGRSPGKSPLRSPKGDEAEEEEASGSETTETETDEEGAWGSDYVTRCICGLQHNDEFMVACDECDVWQHCRCMGLSPKAVPDSYLCERCQPRQLRIAPAKARHFQLQKLSRLHKEKERLRKAKHKRKQDRRKDAQRRKAERQRAKTQAATNAARAKALEVYTEIAVNEYTDSCRAWLDGEAETLGGELLRQLSPASTAVMFVASGRQGLVATADLPLNAPVAEWRGKVFRGQELSARDKNGRPLPYVLHYDGFPAQGEARHQVAIDARQRGSAARFARRSCRPNTVLRHVILEGRLHVVLVASEPIERGCEVTLPLDWDYRASRWPLECACAQLLLPEPDVDGDDPCPVLQFNRELEAQRVAAEAKAAAPVAPKSVKLKKQPAPAPKSPLVKRPVKSVAAKKVAAANRLKIRMAASKALKDKAAPKGSPKDSPPAGRLGQSRLRVKTTKAFSSDAFSSHDEEEAEEGELKVSPRPKAPKRETPKPKTPATAPATAPVTSPSRPMDREERKMAEMIAMVARMEEAERRKNERKSASPKKPKLTPPNHRNNSTKKPSQGSSTKSGQRGRPARFPTESLMSASSAEAESFSDSELDSDKEAASPRPQPTPLHSLRHAAPPRKRWISNQRQAAQDDSSPSPAPAGPTPPSGGTKKRWLRQAMSEDHSPATVPPPARPPPKKRRVEEEDLSAAEALAQMGARQPPAFPQATQAPISPPIADLPAPLPNNTAFQPPAVTPAPISLPPQPPAEILKAPEPPPPVSNQLSDRAPAAEPAPMIKKRKKVSLDEYKKRKSFVSTESAESTPTPQLDAAAPAFPPPSQPTSFIPQMDQMPLDNRPMKLTSLPDPTQIGKGTATFEDLKARIYGRKLEQQQAAGVSLPPVPPPVPALSGAPQPASPLLSPPQPVTPSASSHFPAGSPPPPESPQSGQPSAPFASPPRMSLSDRLRTEFGLDAEDLNASLSGAGLASPSPPRPPLQPQALVNGRARPAFNAQAASGPTDPRTGPLSASLDEEEEAEDGEIRDDSPRPAKFPKPPPPPPQQRHQRSPSPQHHGRYRRGY